VRLSDFDEKRFIHEVLGPSATTATANQFDDAVVIDLAELTGQPEADYLVYSMDQPSFVRHPDPDLSPFHYYGRWVAGTTCNDVIAMGARCRGFSLALAAPSDTEVDDVAALVRGITDVLARCGAAYEGGNFDRGPLGTVGLAWGTAPRDGLVRRSGARPGDRIAVTGELGLGWLEYQLRSHDLTHRVEPEDRAVFRGYKAMPVGEARAVAAVAERGWLTSGMDLSDGLVEFLYTIRNRNGVGCTVDVARLPVTGAVRRNLPLLAEIVPAVAGTLRAEPALVAFDPGYDSPMRHAFTVRPEAVGPARRVFQEHGASLEIIGEVTDGPAVVLDRGGRRVPIPPFWDDQLREQKLLSAWAEFIRELG
jgi:thiamine-monophosphate kinase